MSDSNKLLDFYILGPKENLDRFWQAMYIYQSQNHQREPLVMASNSDGKMTIHAPNEGLLRAFVMAAGLTISQPDTKNKLLYDIRFAADSGQTSLIKLRKCLMTDNPIIINECNKLEGMFNRIISKSTKLIEDKDLS